MEKRPGVIAGPLGLLAHLLSRLLEKVSVFSGNRVQIVARIRHEEDERERVLLSIDSSA